MELTSDQLNQLGVYIFVSVLLGYAVALVMIQILPKRLRAENATLKDDILSKAQKQKQKILLEAKRRTEEKSLLKMEEVESEIEERHLDLKSSEEELNILADTIQQAEQRLSKQISDINHRKSKLENLTKRYSQCRSKLNSQRGSYRQALEKANPNIDTNNYIQKLSDDLVRVRSLAAQKSLKDLDLELSTHANRNAVRMLTRVSSRYAPDFVWPKSSYVVEIADPKTSESLNSDSYTLLDDLRELTEEVSISLTTDKEETQVVGVKLAGGYGIYKEAAKLTLEQLLNKNPREWGAVREVYEGHKQNLNRKAFQLGKEAVEQLRLPDMHDEILRMVGALNWRTSYRQNQYLHSVEVSTLAGIVAQELGVDPTMAKRCGLLHDIGKGIDYRIEGSHAVISGDYADRFGESKLVCDTVMSHHNDLVLETPLSYVLKTADTLSGARPGARVNIEEGYQIRLSAIEQTVRSFKGIVKIAIMNGGREVHIDVAHNKVSENELEKLTTNIARKIEEDVAYPGQIKVLVTRRFEASAIA